MEKDYFDQLRLSRSQTQLKSTMAEQPSASGTDWFICMAQGDAGVSFNMGRRGAEFGPRVLLNQLGLMQRPQHFTAKLNFGVTFENAHLSNLMHLGAGHDHLYHLLNYALDQGKKDFVIINIDAHADMRTDPVLHSGTPIRYFFEQQRQKISTYRVEQWGLSKFYQNPRDLELKGATVAALWEDDLNLEKVKERLEEIKKTLSKQSVVILSVDADVVSGSSMKAVSAVNPGGIEPQQLAKIIKLVKVQLAPHQPILGLYEYNPLYEDASNFSARFLASLLYQWIV